MQKFLLIKLSIISVLCLIFVVVLTMISGLVDERKNYEHSVISEIEQTQISSQTLITPFIVEYKGGKALPILPTTSTTKGVLDVTHGQYARGIYKATSYTGKLTIAQSYAKTPQQVAANPEPTPNPPQGNLPQAAPTQTSVITQATATQTSVIAQAAPTQKLSSFKLVIPISDLRGVNLPSISLNGKSYVAQFAQSNLEFLGQGQSFLEVDFGTYLPNEVNFELDLSGLTGLSFVPLGNDSSVQLTGNWQDPKFYGNALPTQKTLNQTGFSASWQTPFLAQQNNAILLDNEGCVGICVERFQSIDTDFVLMDNAYTKTDRTIKYALILLLVSFGAFFLFEMIKGLKIHPIQYLLVASGLLVFYALLLSLAELMAFLYAYTIASVACVSLIGWYASFVLKSVVRSVIFSLILSGLYAGFYVILSVSQMNLLLGAVFCFILLFVVMFITKNIDWYGMQNAPSTRKSLMQENGNV